MKHIISVLLENEAGALSRVVGLFSARGYNIESLTVAATEDQSLSRMTIVTRGSDEVIEQITKHLNRLIEVVKVIDLADYPSVERELMLIKVRATGNVREEIKRSADIFRAQIVDVNASLYTIQIVGDKARAGRDIGGKAQLSRFGSCGRGERGRACTVQVRHRQFVRRTLGEGQRLQARVAAIDAHFFDETELKQFLRVLHSGHVNGVVVHGRQSDKHREEVGV